MPLRARLLLAVALVLIVSALGGVALAGWQARKVLDEELTLALVGGRQTVVTAFEALPRSEHPARDLERLVATFDDSRHVRAVLVGAAGAPVAASRPAGARTPPPWFAALFRPPVEAVVLRPPDERFSRLRLEPVFANDVAAIWAEFVDLLVVLTASLIAGSGLVWLTMGRALAPLEQFDAAFRAIGAGDYAARAPAGGPGELARLARSVNAMAERLGAMQAANRALEAQIADLQEEERADLARDLHDEIGPHLFAVNVDAAMARRLIGEGRPAEAAAPLASIQAAAAHMQRLVRDILGRLRPTPLVELGLLGAVGELVAFWRARHGAIAFSLDLPADETDVPEPLRETLYRLIQEALSNAVRHGRPGAIAIAVARLADGRILASIRDDGRAPATRGGGGLGLKGMRERVEAAGGELRVHAGQSGWAIEAVFPLRQPAAAA